MHALALLPTDAITTHDGEPQTDSLKVAEAFNKQHKDVLKRLHNLDCSTEFSRSHAPAWERVKMEEIMKKVLVTEIPQLFLEFISPKMPTRS